jgi:phosphopantetheinyl transferase
MARGGAAQPTRRRASRLMFRRPPLRFVSHGSASCSGFVRARSRSDDTSCRVLRSFPHGLEGRYGAPWAPLATVSARGLPYGTACTGTTDRADGRLARATRASEVNELAAAVGDALDGAVASVQAIGGDAFPVLVLHAAILPDAGDCDYWRYLSSEERSAARRYVFSDDRVRFGISRAVVRLALARGTCRPSTIKLAADSRGRVSAPREFPAFSIAHSGRDLLVGIAGAKGRVGVDIETLPADRLARHRAVIETELSPSELARIRCGSGEGSCGDVLKLWVRKEATLKALGVGLRIPPRTIQCLDDAPLSTSPNESLSAQLRRLRVWDVTAPPEQGAEKAAAVCADLPDADNHQQW